MKIVGILIGAVVIAGAAFFGGMQYQKSQQPQAMMFGGPGGNGTAAPAPGGAQGGQRMGGRNGGENMSPVTGEIVSQDDKSITVKTTDGSTKIVLFSSDMKVSKSEEAAVTDLKTGQKVLVIGTTNTDGSVTAENIQLNPQNRGGMMFRAPSGAPTGTGNNDFF